jgi:hypothetical protein
MMSEYGIHLGNALWGERPMSVRRLGALLAGLPARNALARALDPKGVGSDWGHVEELLATQAELIDQGNRLFYQAHAKKGSRDPEPIKIRRPWDEELAAPVASQDELRAYTQTHNVPVKGG